MYHIPTQFLFHTHYLHRNSCHLILQQRPPPQPAPASTTQPSPQPVSQPAPAQWDYNQGVWQPFSAFPPVAQPYGHSLSACRPFPPYDNAFASRCSDHWPTVTRLHSAVSAGWPHSNSRRTNILNSSPSTEHTSTFHSSRFSSVRQRQRSTTYSSTTFPPQRFGAATTTATQASQPP